jgi:hypothetical protein
LPVCNTWDYVFLIIFKDGLIGSGSEGAKEGNSFLR